MKPTAPHARIVLPPEVTSELLSGALVKDLTGKYNCSATTMYRFLSIELKKHDIQLKRGRRRSE